MTYMKQHIRIFNKTKSAIFFYPRIDFIYPREYVGKYLENFFVVIKQRNYGEKKSTKLFCNHPYPHAEGYKKKFGNLMRGMCLGVSNHDEFNRFFLTEDYETCYVMVKDIVERINIGSMYYGEKIYVNHTNFSKIKHCYICRIVYDGDHADICDKCAKYLSPDVLADPTIYKNYKQCPSCELPCHKNIKCKTSRYCYG